MRLLEITISNFLSFGSMQTFKLDKRGILLIEGRNEDTNAADSNGSGKSTLFEAIVWGLWGVTMRGLTGDEVINKLKLRNCTVSLQMWIDGCGYVVERNRNHSEHSNGLFLWASVGTGEPDDLRGATAKDTQEKINRLIGMDYQTFINTLMFGQGMSGLFSQLTDRDQKAILERILNIEHYNKAQEGAKVKVAELTQLRQRTFASVGTQVEKQDEKNGELEQAQRRAGQFDQEVKEAVEGIKARIKLDEDELKTLKPADWEQEHEATISEANEALEELSEQLKEVPRIKSLIKELNDTIRSDTKDFNERIRATQRSLDGQASDRFNCDSHIKNLECRELKVPEYCPTCLRGYDPTHVHQDLKKLEDARERDIAAYKSSRDKADKEAKRWELVLKDLTTRRDEREQKLTAERDELEKQLESFSEVLEMQGELKTEVMRLQSEIKNAKDKRDLKRESLEKSIRTQKVQLTHEESRTNTWDSRVVELKRALKDLEKSIFELTFDLEKIDQELEHYKFWVDGFGNQGIKSFLLDGVVPILNEKANEYSKILTDGDIVIQFNTQTKLKSGEYRDKFEVSAVNADGADIYKGNSSGEKRRIDLCVMFALHHLVRSQSRAGTNVIFMDEVFDSLDATGAERVVQLLQTEMGDKDSVFVITHNPDLRQHFDKCMTVVKSKGLSTLEG